MFLESGLALKKHAKFPLNLTLTLTLNLTLNLNL
jgi:hypothetical protein